jgi:hypothetical protein
MKTIIQATKPKVPVDPLRRSFRRFIRKMFVSFLNRQRCEYPGKFQATVLEKLQDIEDLLEIMARETARQARRGNSPFEP